MRIEIPLLEHDRKSTAFTFNRGVQKLGLLKSTWGKTYVNEMPSSSTAGSLSGTQIHTRVDYGMLVQTNMLPIIYDVNVA